MDENKGFWSGLSPGFKAVLVALFVYPGAGQIMNGQKVKGIAVGLVFTAATLGALFQTFLVLASFYETLTSLGEPPQLWPDLLKLACWFAGSGVIWLFAVADAWFCAPRAVERKD
ncbi:MAG: hypothetical protein HY319_18540 [Armatimonadetes bacterium]|nr:hypothetical protein [Armatimonadota bacterium]